MSHQLSLLFFFLSSFLLQVTHLVLSFFLFFFFFFFFLPSPLQRHSSLLFSFFVSSQLLLLFFSISSHRFFSFFLHFNFFFILFSWWVVIVFFGHFWLWFFGLDYFSFSWVFSGFVMFVLLTRFMTWDQSFKYQYPTLKIEIFWPHFMGLFYEIKAFIFFHLCILLLSSGLGLCVEETWVAVLT